MSPDLRDRLDQALASATGVTLTFESPDQARSFRMAVYAARRHDASKNVAVYPAGDPLHGVSVYDSLTLRIAGSSVHIEHRKPMPEAKPIRESASNG